MVSVDGVLYHAVDINEMPDSAVVFAAANQSIPSHIQINENIDDGIDHRANLEKILMSFSKDRKKYKLRNKRKQDTGTLSLSNTLNISNNAVKKYDEVEKSEKIYFDSSPTMNKGRGQAADGYSVPADHHSDREGEGPKSKYEGLVEQVKSDLNMKKRRPSSSNVYSHTHTQNRIQETRNNVLRRN